MAKYNCLTEEQIKSIMPEYGTYGEQLIDKITLYDLCRMALEYRYLWSKYVEKKDV